MKIKKLKCVKSNRNILIIDNLAAGYDGNVVLDGISMSANKGEICCIIGEEGSGKSTLLNAISQQLNHAGRIVFNDINLKEYSTDKMIMCSVDFIMQGGNILKNFSVEEHLEMAMTGKNTGQRKLILEDIEEIFPTILQLKKQIAGRLSGGERMLLSLACLMATDAKLWILDEPTAGLAPDICIGIKNFLIKTKNTGQKTILLLEHNFEFAFEISDSLFILKERKISQKYLPKEFLQKDFIDINLYNN